MVAGAVRGVVLLHERGGVLPPLVAGAARYVRSAAVLLAVLRAGEPVARPTAGVLAVAAVLLPSGATARFGLRPGRPGGTVTMVAPALAAPPPPRRLSADG